jgi:transposase
MTAPSETVFPLVAIQQVAHGRRDHEGTLCTLGQFLDFVLEWREVYENQAHKSVLEAGKARPVQGSYSVRFYAPDAPAVALFRWFWKGKDKREIESESERQCTEWPKKNRDERWKGSEAERRRTDPIVVVLRPRTDKLSTFIFSTDVDDIDLVLARCFLQRIDKAKQHTATYDLYLVFGDKSVNTCERARQWDEEKLWPKLVQEWLDAWRDRAKQTRKAAEACIGLETTGQL